MIACSPCDPAVTLHILSASPYTGSCLDDCRRIATAGDALLLSGDGVYALRGAARTILEALRADGVMVQAIAEDCTARGIDDTNTDGIERIDYGGFVDLSVAHEHSVSWF